MEETITPISPDDIKDLRRRVLAGEEVSDQELQAALISMCRPIADQPSKPKLPAGPKIDVLGLIKNQLAKKAAETSPDA